MNNAADKIPALVAEELEAANRVHPRFNSAHEGYAVMLEETEETRYALSDLERQLSDLWRAVKTDDLNAADCTAFRVELNAREVAAEAIQVAAMARKFQTYCADERVRLNGRKE